MSRNNGNQYPPASPAQTYQAGGPQRTTSNGSVQRAPPSPRMAPPSPRMAPPSPRMAPPSPRMGATALSPQQPVGYSGPQGQGGPAGGYNHNVPHSSYNMTEGNDQLTPMGAQGGPAGAPSSPGYGGLLKPRTDSKVDRSATMNRRVRNKIYLGGLSFSFLDEPPLMLDAM